MEENRESLFVLATLSENCERYEECMRYMVKISELGEPLSVDERNTLSVSCKNVVGKLRSGLRYLDHLAEKKEGKDSPCFEKVTNLMRDQIRGELTGVCDDVIALLDKHLIPASQSPEDKVFYYKMKADYLRYKAEFATGDHLQEVRKDCLVVYKKASEIANSELPPCNVVRLGLSLNFSVFYYEILGNQTRAHDMAKHAFKEATEHMDDASPEESRDINLILQLLRDNLTLWGSDAPSGDERSSPARPEEEVAA